MADFQCLSILAGIIVSIYSSIATFRSFSNPTGSNSSRSSSSWVCYREKVNLTSGQLQNDATMPPYTVEASYQYSPLPEGHIRLLQLLPDSNINAPVHGVIFDYPLLNFIRSAHHLYEALSYAWGSLEKACLISINNCNLPVTSNLYSALQHLRDPLLKRTLWIDAICINQNDIDERRLQVQSMVLIYTMASHVIVWLGEAETDGKRALEEIHRAAYLSKQPTEISQTVQDRVLKLLQRPWFKRIWVLQEVAAARNTLIMYDSVEIDGHTFCLGVNSLGDIYKGNPDLKSIIPTALYLIGRTVYRPEKAPGELRKFSLNISTLAELLDTYHAREASDRHDKVYALLGMSSDGYSSGGFSPDYTYLWGSLFQQVIRFILGEKHISITTWDDKDVAVINIKGCTLGKVSEVHLVENSSVWGGRQTVIISKARSNVLDQRELWDDYQATGDNEENWHDVWILNVLAKSIQRDDILCLLQGATKPTLIRPYKTYFIVIAIAVNPIDIRPAKQKVNSWPDILPMKVNFPRDFALIWDWKEVLPSLENKDEGDLLNHQALRYGEIDLRDILDGRELLINTALILGDVAIHERAKMLIKKAIEDYKTEFGDEHPHTLRAMHKLAWIYKKSNHQWDESVFLKEGKKLEATAGILGRQGFYSQITTKKMAHLVKNYNEEVISLLLDRRGNEITITEEVLTAAARNKHSNKEMLALLLERRGDEITITEKVIDAVASNYGNRGDEVMEMLLNQRGDEITTTEKVVKAIMSNYRPYTRSAEVLKLLLDRQRDKIAITKGIFNADIGNQGGFFAFILKGHRDDFLALLLERHGDQITVAENAVPIIAQYHSLPVMTLLLDRQEEKVTVTEKLIKAAAKNIDGEQVLKLLLSRRGDEITITEKVIKAAARSSRGAKVIKLLLNYTRGNITITEGIIKAVIENVWEGVNIIKLLFIRQEGKITITEKVVETAASNGEHGKTVMTLLLNQQRDQVIIRADAIPIVIQTFDREMALLLLEQQQNNITITSEICKAAARNCHSVEVMKLLLDRHGDKITITGEIIRVAAENEKYGTFILQLLLNHIGDKIIITEEVLKAIAKNTHYGGEKAIRQLLDQRGDEIKITEGVMKAAAGNNNNSIAMLKLFLGHGGDKIIITEEVFKAAAATNDFLSRRETVEVLLDQRGDEIIFTGEIIKALITSLSNSRGMIIFLNRYRDKIPITEDIIKAIAGHPDCYGGTEMMKLLLDQRGDEITITEEVAKAAARNNKETMIMLLREREDEITITEAIVQAAAENFDAPKLLELLLDQCGNKVAITEETIRIVAANNHYYSNEIIKLLLNQQGDKIPITEEIIIAVAKRERHGKEIMELFLRGRGDKIHITEEIIRAVAANKHPTGKEMMELLLDQRGYEITITERIVQVVAANEHPTGKEMMELLLDQRGYEITITERIVQAVAVSRHHHNKKVMEMLLDQRGDEITITESIVEAVAANEHYRGKEMMELLLDKRGDEITITEEIIKAAAGNEKNGKKFIKLLLNWQKEKFTITEEVIKVAAANRNSGKKILELLLSRREDNVIIQEDILEIANMSLLQKWQED